MNYFSMLIKPASSLCNLRCKYCFYEDVSNHREEKSYGIMTRETVDILLERLFSFLKAPAAISFVFQGGEPTLAGVEYFAYFTKKADELNKKNFEINYSIQTNGTLIDEEFCKLFQDRKFLVGISQDGPPQFHDYNRINAKMLETYDQTKQAIKLLKKYSIDFNILSVITKQMAKKPKTLFNYYRKMNFNYIQLIPCLKSLDYIAGGDINKFDLTPHEYAMFMKDFFQLWYDELTKNNNYISVRQFDNLVTMLKGQPPEQCGLSGRCNIQCVVEADGSVYPCDFYVLDEYKLGNLHTETIEQLVYSTGSKAFMNDTVSESSLCKSCKVYGLCGGGCKRYRSFYSEEEGYCPYQDFLYFAYDKLINLAKIPKHVSMK